MADGFRQVQGGNKSPHSAQHSAALVFVVKALVDDRMRAAQPERKFPGYTDVSVLADAVQRIFDLDTEQINGQRLSLTAGHLAGAPV